ncbi:MAG: glucokinase [Hyphomicrobiales bacterium]|nr:MAG: glucokinase [Hyphomicrobiales bacterium]
MTVKSGLVADIGGTNARLGIAEGLGRPVRSIRVYAGRDFNDFESLIRAYLSDSGEPMPRHGCLAIAGPVADNRARLTNGAWGVDGNRIASLFGMEACEVVNDFTALAWALPWLGEDQLLAVGPAATPRGEARRARLVVGPGTGLGVSALIEQGGLRVAVRSEGGHVGFAPRDEAESELLNWFRLHYERVSAERLMCGHGLELLHQALGDIAGQPRAAVPAPEITAGALADPKSEHAGTIDCFLGLLGAFAGDLCLAMGADRVYIGGGIVPRLTQILPQSPFRRRFTDKGRFQEHLEAIPTHVITDPLPALAGTSARMFDPCIPGSPFET